MRQASMTIKEYCLKFNQLSKYAPDLISDPRASMTNFVIGVSGLVLKQYGTAMLYRDIDFARSIMHAQQIEKDKIRERDRVKGNKWDRSEQHKYSQPRFHVGNRHQFQRCPSIPIPSSASAPTPRGRQEQGANSFMSRSQNSVSNRPHYPPCAKCGRDHPGEYFTNLKGCFGCGKHSQRLRDCPHARKGTRGARPQAQTTSTSTYIAHPDPIQGTLSSIAGGQSQNIFYALRPIRIMRTLSMLLVVCSASFILKFMCSWTLG